MSSEQETQLERVIAPICTEIGVDLVDVELRANALLVTVDQQGGLDLDRVAEAARAISVVLDAEELGPQGHYELEVSSPGIERRLRRPAHFSAVIGQLVALRTVAGTEGDRRFQATLVAADAEGIDVLPDGAEVSRRLTYNQIDRAHTVVDWDAALRGASARKKTKEVASS